MYADRLSPAAFASATICHRSAEVIRNVTLPDSFSVGGFGGLPIFVFFFAMPRIYFP
jgi:hypothetical protein